MQTRLLLVLVLFIHVKNVQSNNNKMSDEDSFLYQLANTGSNNTFRQQLSTINEDLYLNTSQMLRKYGKPVEEYFVITEDGYNLTMIRIPGQGPTVLVMHGILGSSDDFVSGGPDKALAYQLANNNYDVWLGNARGSFYSRRHIKLSPKKRDFWLFSWHEIGFYDLPAMIDFALKTANRSQLTYIGHSQGTTISYVLCSLRPEYNKKIIVNLSMAPVAWMWHLKPPLLRAMTPLYRQEQFILDTLGLYEVLPRDTLSKIVTSILCASSRLSQLVCITVMFALFGFDYSQIDYQALPTQFSHIPSGASLRQSSHFAQLVVSKQFAQFNHGREENLRIYGTNEPPSYPVENITVPTVMFYGQNDYISVIDDIQILIDRLPNVVGIYKVPHPKFNHFDFLWAKNVKKLLYWKLLDVIKKSTQTHA